MKAWELERRNMDISVPKHLDDNNEEFWEEQQEGPEEAQDALMKVYWSSKVPGSRASESLMVAAVQATENRGYIVKGAQDLWLSGLSAVAADEKVAMHKGFYEIMEACRTAEKDESSPYWKQQMCDSFADHEKAVKFPQAKPVVMDDSLVDRMEAGWLAQIIGGAYGTCMEGYTTTNILKTYPRLDIYQRKPNTYNDDITYELALLLAYEAHGKNTTSKDIALEWATRIPSGWSAEDMALRNLRCGILPPESGTFNNPFCEWIGAQMRGVTLGQLYPGDPYQAAKAAWQDGLISHARNGVLGETFNAIMTAMAFTEKDIRKIVTEAVEMMPEHSEYGECVRFALEQCHNSQDWLTAWRPCEKKYERYNWVHAYPNAAAEVIALWFGAQDFTKLLVICGGCGQDVDCNAAQVATVWATVNGKDAIPAYWTEPIGDKLITYVRGLKELSIRQLAQRTAEVARTLAK
jgi:ADP-ribosylglycohydrolase